jgi:hypothetical protein
MAPKSPSVSEQREKVDRLRSELQKPAVMSNPRRAALLKEAFTVNEALFRALQAKEGKKGRGSR